MLSLFGADDGELIRAGRRFTSNPFDNCDFFASCVLSCPNDIGKAGRIERTGMRSRLRFASFHLDLCTEERMSDMDRLLHTEKASGAAASAEHAAFDGANVAEKGSPVPSKGKALEKKKPDYSDRVTPM